MEIIFDVLSEARKNVYILTTEHPASHYGAGVLVDETVFGYRAKTLKNEDMAERC